MRSTTTITRPRSSRPGSRRRRSSTCSSRGRSTAPRARMTRPGYAIEYDYYPPTQLTPWLETKALEHLFFAGQINGTTGYEEAAGQGIVAGINCVRRIRDQEPVVFGRDDAYVGVLVDDLVTRGV